MQYEMSNMRSETERWMLLSATHGIIMQLPCVANLALRVIAWCCHPVNLMAWSLAVYSKSFMIIAPSVFMSWRLKARL